MLYIPFYTPNHKNIKDDESFTRDFTGEVWLEILILPGFNDSKSSLLELKAAVKRINPALVQLNTLDRPGTLFELKAASQEDLERVKKILDFPNTRIISRGNTAKKTALKSSKKELQQAILNTINRRPCTAGDLVELLAVQKEEIIKHLTDLELKAVIKGVRKNNSIFYSTLKKPN